MTDENKWLQSQGESPLGQRESRVDRKKLGPDDLRRMNLPEEFWSPKNAGWQGLTASIKPVVENYFRTFDQRFKAGTGFSLYGPTGVGKTSTLAVVLKAARERLRTGYFLRVSELRDAMRSETDFDSVQTVMDRCASVEFLALDGFGEADLKAPWFNLTQLRELVISRAQRGRPTFVAFSCSQVLVLGALPDFTQTTGKYIPDFLLNGPDRNEAVRRAAKASLLGKGS